MDSCGRDLAVSSNSMHASKKIVKVGGVSHHWQVLWGQGEPIRGAFPLQTVMLFWASYFSDLINDETFYTPCVDQERHVIIAREQSCCLYPIGLFLWRVFQMSINFTASTVGDPLQDTMFSFPDPNFQLLSLILPIELCVSRKLDANEESVILRLMTTRWWSHTIITDLDNNNNFFP